MKSRMEKYYKSNDSTSLRRSERNEKLYETISDIDLESFNVNSNVAVLGDNKSKLDISEIQDLIKTRYEDSPKRRSIKLDFDETHEYEIPEEDKDYDINTILKKARDEKLSDYQTDRLKKLRDTQYDILKDLEFNKEENDDTAPVIETLQSTMESADEKLMTLIKTITSKEFAEQEKDYVKKQKEEIGDSSDLDPLDILSDLKGTEHTMITKAVTTEDSPKKDIKDEVQDQLNKTFFTASNSITPSDFDDINDLKEDIKKSKMLIKILIGLIILAFVFGIIVLLNTVLGLGWF